MGWEKQEADGRSRRQKKGKQTADCEPETVNRKQKQTTGDRKQETVNLERNRGIAPHSFRFTLSGSQFTVPGSRFPVRVRLQGF